MKTMNVVWSIALSGVVLSSALTPASATKMDGRCCTSSDGGRSYRYRMAVRRLVIPRTCSAYAVSCVHLSSAKPDRVPMCMAAKSECLQTGVLTGPYSGRLWFGLDKI
jgi:hypothetical protein